jgi:hypothetical protein
MEDMYFEAQLSTYMSETRTPTINGNELCDTKMFSALIG